MKTATEEALDQCTDAVRAVVRCWVRQHGLPRGWAPEDLKQEALVGVLRALKTYDPTKGPWVAYAVLWMKARMRQRTQKHYRHSARELWLDNPVQSNTDEPDPTTWAHSRATEPVDLVECAQQAAQVRRAARLVKNKFGHRGLDLLYDRILSDDPVILDVLAERYGVTRERVRQIEVKMLGYLRTKLEAA